MDSLPASDDATAEKSAEAAAGVKSWLDAMPSWSHLFFQFGFAGLFAVMFWIQFRDNEANNRYNRDMWREEQHAMRMEIRAAIDSADKRGDQADRRSDMIATKILEMTFEIRRTTDVLRSAGVKLEKAAEKEWGGPIPPPHSKGGLPVPRLPADSTSGTSPSP